MRRKMWVWVSVPAMKVPPIHTKCPNHVLAVFPGPCLHPVSWGRPWRTFSAFATGTRPSRHRSGDIGHPWLPLVTFELASYKETENQFRKCFLSQKALIETSEGSLWDIPSAWSFCKMRALQWVSEILNQVSDSCKSKGSFDDLLRSVSAPSSFFNASGLYAFLSCIVSIAFNSCSAHHSRALRPVFGLQPTIPRSGKCANYAAARAPSQSTSRTESRAMRKWRLAFGVEGASWQCHAGEWKKSRTPGKLWHLPDIRLWISIFSLGLGALLWICFVEWDQGIARPRRTVPIFSVNIFQSFSQNLEPDVAVNPISHYFSMLGIWAVIVVFFRSLSLARAFRSFLCCELADLLVKVRSLIIFWGWLPPLEPYLGWEMKFLNVFSLKRYCSEWPCDSKSPCKCDEMCRIEWVGWWREDLTWGSSETPASLLSTWPLPRANSAGPRWRVSRQQNHRKSLPERQPDRRWRCEGAGTAAGWWLRGCGTRITG